MMAKGDAENIPLNFVLRYVFFCTFWNEPPKVLIERNRYRHKLFQSHIYLNDFQAKLYSLLFIFLF